ncbi:hypothetical protein FS842_001679 [Serendipita sp. 407]|nr:hypothetical protein FS842_001679 [Serendipita sp. 407]
MRPGRTRAKCKMDSNHDRTGNSRLPFEVLSHVFGYYLKEESSLHPLETLLLICKDWQEAALGTRSLWATYRITLGDERATERWVSRLPVRMQRAGRLTLFHIDIRHVDHSSGRFGESTRLDRHQLDASWNTPRLLEILAGKDGSLCCRWKELRITIDSPSVIFGSFNSIKYQLAPLTYPMPSLTSLHLKIRTMSGVPLFPQLPSLQSVILEDCFLIRYPDMSNAREIYLDNVSCGIDHEAHHVLWNAFNLQYLHINNNNHSTIYCSEYPTLRTLSLQGEDIPRSLQRAAMPELETLIIEFSRIELIAGVADLPAIGQIHTLHLTGYDETLLHREDGLRAIWRILNMCSGLETLYVNEFVLSFIFEDWSIWGHLFAEQGSTIKIFLQRKRMKDIQLVLGDRITSKALQLVTYRYNVPLPEPLIREIGNT